MIRKLICALAAAAAFAAPAGAQDTKTPVFMETRAVPNKPGFAIDPAKGYVLLRSDLGSSLFLSRVPSADDKAVYERWRLALLAKARAKYPGKVRDYEKAFEVARTTGGEFPVRPVEPTEENFQATPFDLLTMVSIGPLFRYAKSKDKGSTYLQELTPGEYRIYGPILISPSGPMGTCFCMGSVKFEVRAGEITDIGAILSKDMPPPPPADDSSMPQAISNAFLVPAPPELPLDPRLAGMPMRRAVFQPVGKSPNYYGIAIGRIPPMPGVIAYDRDRIIDLTATATAPQ
jgi:hypothetical protein